MYDVGCTIELLRQQPATSAFSSPVLARGLKQTKYDIPLPDHIVLRTSNIVH
jgi:hypothetical protein